jgi:hypothetical protein
MAQPSRKFWTLVLTVLAIAGLLTGMLLPLTRLPQAQAATAKQGTASDYIKGPFSDQPVYPAIFNGDVRDLPQLPSSEGGEVPAPKMVKQIGQGNSGSTTTGIDQVTQQSFAHGHMPEPIANFEGVTKAEAGGWTPPDTNGDVGPDHYIQTVNIAVGIYDKTGTQLALFSYDSLFEGTGTSCDNQNRGDVIVLYDPLVDRWLLTDFSLPTGGPYLECIAVSQTGDPISGGWYFYALRANTGYFNDFWNDYPKLGIWADGWYMSANMFDSTFGGVRVWALDRESMIIGGALNEVHYDCEWSPTNDYCQGFLPANYRGELPPTGAPEYFANVMVPNTLNFWKFHVDWDIPANSTFTGPIPVEVADFAVYWDVPQKDVAQTLDTLGDRLMMQLQYRNIEGIESLYVNHSVVSGEVGGIRWYEIRDLNSTPTIFQQGTYQPDDNYRWMGSIAADQDGNIAVGYSVSSGIMFPAIRYAGRLAGETPNLLTQNEAVLFQGSGSQSGSNRWGDYSAMTVDPVDDCTFWYTQEYATTGSNWRTRIGSFKFPSCGQPKGSIEGYVYDSISNLPLAGAPVFATQGATFNFSTVTDESGFYSMQLMAGSYDVTAGPFLPGYPEPVTANLTVTPPDTTTHDFYLSPVPNLVHANTSLADPSGNNNGFPEPGEQDLQLFEGLLNNGGITSTLISATLTSLTEGVTLETADTTYPDIAVGETVSNTTPYVFSIGQGISCGGDLNFQALITDSITTYTTTFMLDVGVPQERDNFYYTDVEDGTPGWTTGGTPNTWAITANQSHSPAHSWTDSPAGNYQNNANNWVRTQTLDLTGVKYVQVSGWFKYALEAGYDYAYVEYSLDGGTTWASTTPLAIFNGTQLTWQEVTMDAPMLDNQPNVALRFRLKSDGGFVMDGFYVDDLAISYVPFECTYQLLPDAPTLVYPADGSWVSSPVTFVWQPAAGGAPTEGYIFYLDNTPVMTFTGPITTTTLDVTPWTHTWSVAATNNSGTSDPSTPWTLDVFGKLFLPVVEK